MKKLFSTTCIPSFAGTKKPPFLRRFAQDEDGNVTMLSIALLMILLMLAGVSWDVNNHEYHRVKIQATADRAVLAAADLDQERDPQVVVNEYFEKVGYPDLVADVRVEEGLNFRTVSVQASGIVEANSIVGTYKGNAYLSGRARHDALAAADDMIADLEANSSTGTIPDQVKEDITEMALRQASEIDALALASARDALDLPEDANISFEQMMAEEFDKAVKESNYIKLNAFSEAEERVNNVEISMVLDISGSMGSGDKMANLRDAARTFVDTVINDSTQDLVSISVVPYSEHVSAGPEIMEEFNVDVNNPYSHCLEFSEADFSTSTLRQDKQYDQVQHFQWGWNGYSNSVSTPVCPVGSAEDVVAFSQDVGELKDKIGQLVPRGSTSIFAGMKWATGLLDPDFQSINANLVAKGESDPAFVTRPAAFDDHETLKTVILMTDGQNHYSYRINDNYYANYSHAAHWNRYNLDWYLGNYVRSSRHHQFKYLKYWPDYGDTLLESVCDAAKAKSIVVWSIGFEVSDHGADVMRDCASSPSHFFKVEGVEIKEAFKAIARQINQLRLTQ